jgi:hypothetical protein
MLPYYFNEECVMKSDDRICQSCCLPLNEGKLVGTEANGEKSQNYCCHCYKEGNFTQPDATLETILNISARIWADKDPNVTLEEAKVQLKAKMPTLKRWTE